MGARGKAVNKSRKATFSYRVEVRDRKTGLWKIVSRHRSEMSANKVANEMVNNITKWPGITPTYDIVRVSRID